MKTVPTAMQEDLDAGATHHCFCWQVTRSDGAAFGFTDHDQKLEFGSVTFEAETGLSPTAIEQSTGLNVDSMDVMGVLNSISIDEQDIAAGLYDNATIISYRVDWLNTDNRVILLQGSVGEVSRGNMGFVAEIRGLAHELNQSSGRIYEPTCNADLGDVKCGIDLSGTSPAGHAYTISSTVTFVENKNSFRADQAVIQAVPNNWFSQGKVTWTSGANDGLEMEVKSHIQDDAYNTLLLWEPMPFNIEIGDAFTLHTGCDKSPDNCLNKFDNMINLRGFNLIPGNDRVLRAVSTLEDNDGGSIF